MKWTLLLTGALLVVLNVGTMFCPYEPAKFVAFGISALVGVLLLGMSLKGSGKELLNEKRDGVSQGNGEKSIGGSGAQKERSGEAEVVAFLAMLQEKGRLVDFVMEEIEGATDAQLAAAARVVHAGCRKVLMENFAWERVHDAAEGAEVVLGEGYAAGEYRLLGSVPERGPYRGRLLHAGWKAKEVRLPRVIGLSEGRKWPIVAPAEVEVK